MAKKEIKTPQDHKKKATLWTIMNEGAVKQLVDIVEPAIAIFTDPEIKEFFEDDDKTNLQIITLIMRKHATELIRILAALDGISYEEAEYTAGDIIKRALTIAQDDELMGFFSSLR